MASLIQFCEPPERSSKEPTFETKPSTIGALVSVPITQIIKLVNEKVPKTFSAGGNGPDACGKVGIGPLKTDICVGTKYDLEAS